MPDALGEYGLNPVSIAKQRIVEVLTAMKEDEFLSHVQIYNMLNRDVSTPDFNKALNELHTTERIARTTSKTRDGTANVHKYALIRRLSKKQKEVMFKEPIDWNSQLGA